MEGKCDPVIALLDLGKPAVQVSGNINPPPENNFQRLSDLDH